MIWKYIIKTRSKKFGPKLRTSGKIRISSRRIKIWNLKLLCIIIMSIVLKVEHKWIKTLDFIALKVTRTFWFSTNVPCQNGYNFWTQPPTTMKFCQNMLYMSMLEIQKFQECTCTRLYSVKQNIEGDVNLHHPSE